jgi:hypothetical protein
MNIREELLKDKIHLKEQSLKISVYVSTLQEMGLIQHSYFDSFLYIS